MSMNVETLATVLAKENAAKVCCSRGAMAEWCSLECRRTGVHG